ncbi:MAG: metalloregulator ArsR/SmtB family transcription factor [Alphaproteobacteria bacterium]|nr:metalloregulator ArsR/SmtB family transcription factor [Alphaproteobacteria bacterium]
MIYEDRAVADVAAEKLRVYAQPQRLMILSCLLRGERTVGDIDAATGIGQPALSQQLAALRRADLVRTRRDAKLVYYALADDTVRLCVRSMEAMLGGGDPVAAMRELVGRSEDDGDRGPPAGVAGFARVD